MTTRFSAMVLLACIAATVAGPLRISLADVVHLKNGNKIEGEVLTETDETINLKTTVGSITLNKVDIDRIEKGVTALKQYENTVKTLKDDDTLAHYTLGIWCKEHGLPRQAKDEFLKVIAADPEHVEAHRELGHVLQGGKWVTEDESMIAKGFVKHNGTWITRDKAEALAARKKIVELKDRLCRAAKLLGGQNAKEGRKVFESITAAAAPAADPEMLSIAIPALQAVIDSEGPAGRTEAIRTLARLRTPEAFDAIVEALLNEKKSDVAAAAIAELKSLNSKRAARLLAKACEELRRNIIVAANDAKPDIVRAIERASRALGGIAESTAVPELVECLTIEINYLRDKRSSSTMSGPFTSTTESTRTINGMPIEAKTSSSVSISANVPDTELVKYYYNDAARVALRQLTGQRFDFERKKWLEWWAANKPVLPPDEKDFDL